MRNAQGGKIVEGNWLLWILSEETLKSMAHRMVVKVAKVTEPVIEGNATPPSLTLVFTMPIDTRAIRGQEPILGDFYGLTNPEEEKALENLLKN